MSESRVETVSILCVFNSFSAVCSVFLLAMIVGSSFDLVWKYRLRIAKTKLLNCNGAASYNRLEEEKEDEDEDEEAKVMEPTPSEPCGDFRLNLKELSFITPIF